MVAIFKDEARYLPEWLEFHRLVGIEHAYLYDNGSIDNSAAILAPFVSSGFATVLPWVWPRPPFGNVSAQTSAYAHAILNFGAEWRWMAFLDLDEFLFPTDHDSLPGVMKIYEDLPAIAVFWTMFGFSGQEVRPDGLVIENYTMRAPFPTHAKPKSIVNPADVVGVSSPHLFDLAGGPMQAFTESRQLFRKKERLFWSEEIGPRVNGRLRINHYYTRSRSEFEEKIRKREAAGGSDGPKLRAIAEAIEEAPYRDDTIIRFVPALKARLLSRTHSTAASSPLSDAPRAATSGVRE